MDNEILFVETQRFKQWWLWTILLGLNGLLLFGVIKQVVFGETFGSKPAGNAELMVITGFIFLLTFLFASFRLQTQIKIDGIYVRFLPFHSSYKYYPWDRISKSFVRQYSPILEYGGWGLRFGIYGKGTAYNVSGNKGLQLVFTNYKRLLIGTQKPTEISNVLDRIGMLKD